MKLQARMEFLMNNVIYISFYVVFKLLQKLRKNRKIRMRILVAIFNVENSNLYLGELV